MRIMHVVEYFRKSAALCYEEKGGCKAISRQRDTRVRVVIDVAAYALKSPFETVIFSGIHNLLS